MLLNILILEVPSCIYIEYYYYRWDSSCLRSHRSLKVERSYNDDVEHIFDRLRPRGQKSFFLCLHQGPPISANNEQCEQAKLCEQREQRTVRTTNSANGSYCPNSANSEQFIFEKCRTVRTGANIVRWILACTAR